MKFGVPELEDLGDVSGKSVLMRADFNVPLSRTGSSPTTYASGPPCRP
ncbi:MAG: hypothetical protein V9E94_12235 [Microthrixaceae bacterium]